MYGVAGRGVHPDKAEDVGVVELRHDFGFLDQFIILIPELACADAGLKHFHRNGLKGGEKEGKWARIGCNIKMYRLDAWMDWMDDCNHPIGTLIIDHTARHVWGGTELENTFFFS